ncbi:MAG: intradiol ring-cleavage dioxygenase [Burkholderiales bacterium]|nr:intradiol ring-cleavage dioxygenase [Burkholderiales bacterium]
MDRPVNRRTFLVRAGCAAVAPLLATPALADDHPPTPRMTEGPFYPTRFPKDVDADLTRVEGRAVTAQGTVLDVSGRVLDRSGKPRPGARVEIWQCDAQGQYHHVGGPESAGDANFQGFGFTTTDAEGRYTFRTIRPAPYPGRTPHIHFNVLENGRRRLTSQMFVEGEAANARDGIYRSLGREARLVTMSLEPAGAGVRGKLDIVLA